MKPKRYYFLINPSAASGKGYAIWKEVRQIFELHSFRGEVYILKRKGEATEIVQKITDQSIAEVHLIVLGGDGTLNEVLNGIVNFEDTVISCIRTGSGNDFAANIGIHKDVTKAVNHLIDEAEEQILDYGVIDYVADGKKKQRRFLISSGVGYDADICEEAGRSSLKSTLNKINLGKLVYVMTGVKQIFTRKSVAATIYMDEQEPLKIPQLFFVVGMIHEKEGGGVPFCPRADATDGLLDVCLVKKMSKLKLLLAIVLVYLRKHYIFKNITEHRCEKLRVELEQPQWFHIDGETSEKIEQMEVVCQQGLRICK